MGRELANAKKGDLTLESFLSFLLRTSSLRDTGITPMDANRRQERVSLPLNPN